MQYECDVGFLRLGPAYRECQKNGKWSGSTPVCGKAPEDLLFHSYCACCVSFLYDLEGRLVLLETTNSNSTYFAWLDERYDELIMDAWDESLNPNFQLSM